MAAPVNLHTRAAARFPMEWAALPAPARVLCALAEASGLLVANVEGEWLWGGSQAEFERSGLFKPSQVWGFTERGYATTGEGIEAALFRTDDGGIGARVRFGLPGRRSLDRFAAMAARDAAFQAFKAAALVPVDLLPPMDPTPDSIEAGDWRGPIPVELTAATVQSYRRRGIFPMLTAAREWSVSESLARALMADAGEQPGQAMKALRKRLMRDLRAYECTSKSRG